MSNKAITISTIPENFQHANSYLIHGERDYIIDPSWHSATIVETAEQKIALLLVTHCHFDHIRELPFWHIQKQKKLLIPEGDSDFLNDQEANCSLMFGQPMTFAPADYLLHDQEIYNLESGLQIKVLHTPGHTPGSSCYLLEKINSNKSHQAIALFTGDTIFADSIGRTDLKYGNSSDMRKTLLFLKDFLQNSNPDLPILPGHGVSCTAAELLRMNPYVNMI